ncbi:MAG: oxidoreductase [Verrucomicrobia bacterium]|nr:oxidoreductase [Verrucomicrobiota bacterium]
MNKQEKKIHIVGAGVSGLIAAQVLEKQGYSPIVFEKSDRVGGRMKTDLFEGIPLDYGFQVLLDEYPMAKKYLDMEKLDLHYFWSGATLYNGKKEHFGDPLRSPFFLTHTLFYKGAKFTDKIKVFELSNKLRQKSIEDIFRSVSTTTLEYLKNYGFSERIIQHFFKPFFGGIFLEKELNTSSRMFEFIFKMFSEGNACIPKDGMEEIPQQLFRKLTRTQFHFNVEIQEVRDGRLYIEGFDAIESDAVVISTAADQLIPFYRKKALKWKGCLCLYFEVEKFMLEKPIIGLISKSNVFVNNWHEINWLKDIDKKVISVTVIDHMELPEDVLIRKVDYELKNYCGIHVKRLIKCYRIDQALPDLARTDYDIDPSETQVMEKVFVSGDVCLNGSMNAAMLSGQRAAEAVVDGFKYRDV